VRGSTAVFLADKTSVGKARAGGKAALVEVDLLFP
jgi:hypothetical protein